MIVCEFIEFMIFLATTKITHTHISANHTNHRTQLRHNTQLIH